MEFQTRAAQLQLWNGSSYDNAYYVSNAWYDDGTEEGDFKEGWADGDGVLLEDYEFTPGGAYWLKNAPDSNALHVAGQVPSDATVEFECPLNQFMLSGNAFPAAIKLNGAQMTSSDITPVAIDWELEEYMEFQNRATQLQIWNGSSYDNAYYVSNAWYDNGTEEGDYKAGWADGDGVLLEDYEISAGNGFWIKAASGACTLEYNNPIAK